MAANAVQMAGRRGKERTMEMRDICNEQVLFQNEWLIFSNDSAKAHNETGTAHIYNELDQMQFHVL